VTAENSNTNLLEKPAGRLTMMDEWEGWRTRTGALHVVFRSLW